MFLALHSLVVRYPKAAAPAVHEASLELPRGAIGALIGPSGCGKTSLLRSVAGLETPAGGRVTLDGDTLADAAAGRHAPPEARRIGMVFQDHALFPHLTIAQNVAFGLRALPAGERAERTQAMLALVGLAELGARAPHELSGGQQQRVALARALAPRPRLLLLDEPFSSLDVELRERLAQEVRAILKQTDTTALMVTHDQLEAFAIADAVGVMRAGRIEQWDEPYALYHRPATRFVADFIGQGVFSPGTIVQTAAGPVVRTALGDFGGRAECPLPAAYPRGECDVLLRADDIVHDDAAPLKAQVVRKAFRGAEFLYTLRLDSGEPLLALVPSHHDHRIGEWIGIRAELDHVVTFAREPGTAPAVPA